MLVWSMRVDDNVFLNALPARDPEQCFKYYPCLGSLEERKRKTRRRKRRRRRRRREVKRIKLRRRRREMEEEAAFVIDAGCHQARISRSKRAENKALTWS
jgi:hypothetical protein